MKLLVEGWIGFNHSYALVNQYQLLEMYHKGTDLFHNLLPNDFGWNTIRNDHGLSYSDFKILQSIPQSNDEHNHFDVEYRISYPFRTYPSKAKKLYVFGTSEYQFIDSTFFYGGTLDSIYDDSVNIITPSIWSSQGFIKAGISSKRIHVVPHGVNSKVFNPSKKIFQNETRDSLQLKQGDFVLLSMGAMTRNKGIDLLIVAFLILRQKYSHLRLVLKDLSSLYNINAQTIIQSLRNSNFAKYINEEYLNEIILISNNLSLNELSNLYAAVDCYVSPYRAEGFNLTPLEASACGTPILVTKGGATDEYFQVSMGEQIEGEQVQKNELTWIEPNIHSLIEKIAMYIEGGHSCFDVEKSLRYIQESFTWSSVTDRLLKLMSNKSNL